jgi:hypothetical protein
MESLNAYIYLCIKSSFFQITNLSLMKIWYKRQDGENLHNVHFFMFYHLLYF